MDARLPGAGKMIGRGFERTRRYIGVVIRLEA